MYKRLLIFLMVLITGSAFAEPGVIDANVNSANCSGDSLWYDGSDRYSGTFTYTAQWTPNKYIIKYICDEERPDDITEQEVTFDAEYSLSDGRICESRTGREFVKWNCDHELPDRTYTLTENTECKAVWNECADGEYLQDGRCTPCPDGYTNSDGDRNDKTSCYIIKTNVGNQKPADIPENCQTAEYGACRPGTCEYIQHYGIEGETCEPEDCTQPVISVTAQTNAFVNSDGKSCSICATYGDGSYTLSQGGNVGYDACYKELPQTCIQNECENPDVNGCAGVICASSCECGVLEMYKEYSNGNVEGVPTKECTKSVSALIHNSGYYTAEDLSNCPRCARGYSSESNADTGIGVCEKACSVQCNANDENACPAHASCTYDTTYMNSGVQYGDETACNAAESLCPVSVVTCFTGYTYDSTTNTCKPNCNTVDLNLNGGNGGTLVLYKYTDDTKWYTSKTDSTTCSGLVSDLPELPSRSGYTYTGHYNSSVGTTNRIANIGTLDTVWTINDNQVIYAQWNPINCDCGIENGANNCVGSVNENNTCDYTWTCDNGYYTEIQSSTNQTTEYTARCIKCPDEYTTTGISATTVSQCYKTCDKQCVQPNCPNGAISCSYEETTTTGKQYYGDDTCDAEDVLCTITDIVCDTGYSKRSYVNENGNHRYSKGMSAGSDICWLDGVSTNCLGNTVVDLKLYEWSVSFDYGNVHGKSLCSTTSAPSYTVGKPNDTTTGRYCWCKMDNYSLDGQSYDADYFDWIAITDASWSVSACTNYCSDACANRVQNSSVFRSLLFKGTNLYAMCEPQDYNVEYVLNGGEFPATAIVPHNYNITSETITIPNPTKPGAIFVGWCDDADLTENCSTERTISWGSFGDKTLHAKWRSLCETNRWLHVGNEKVCLYDTQQTHPALAIRATNGTVYYANLSQDTDLPLRGGTTMKMHVKIGNKTYNVYDYSVSQ